MTPGCPLRRLARAATLVAAITTVIVGLAPAAPAQVDETVSASIELVDRSPWVAGGDGLVLDIAVSFDGPGSDEVAAESTVRVDIRRPLRDVDELDASATEDVGVVLATVGAGPLGELPEPAAGVRRVEIPSAIGAPGIYPVVVEVVSAEGLVLASVRTPVIGTGPPDAPVAGPRLSLLVDVRVPPTVTPNGRRELTESELERMDRLADLLETDAGATVVAVPDTVDALLASADPRATRLAAALGTATTARTVLAMPYVPVSPAAMADADLGDTLDEIIDAGHAVLADRLDVELDTTVWDGAADVGAGARQLARRGVSHLLLEPGDEGSVEETTGLLRAAGPAPIEVLPGDGAADRLEVLAVDHPTSDWLMEPPGREGGGHAVLAELFLRDDTRGSEVIVRVDDAPEGSAILEVLPLLTVPGSPVTVGPLDVGDDGDAEPVVVPEGDVDDLPADTYRAAAARLATFEQLVGDESARTADLRLRLLTGLGKELGSDTRRALIAGVDDEVAESLGRVHLTGQTDLNLTSRRGALPVTVQNDNPFPVEVLVRIRSDRLRFPAGEEFRVELGTEAQRLDIPVEALATGSVPTFVELWTPDGATRLDSRQLNVRSTAVSGVGLAISLGALAVLVIWWVRSWRRTRRQNPDESEISDNNES